MISDTKDLFFLFDHVGMVHAVVIGNKQQKEKKIKSLTLILR